MTTLPVELLLAYTLIRTACAGSEAEIREDGELASNACLGVIDESLGDEAPDGEDQA